MSGDIEYGRCDVCGINAFLERKYYCYDIKCECHSPNHFEFVSHCKDCKPKEPERTKISFLTSKLKPLK